MAPARSRQWPPGAFTLLELMVALALAVVLAAVVLPVSLSWLPAAGLDEAPPRIESALALARADAQRRGVVVEIVAIETPGGITEIRARDVADENAEDEEENHARATGRRDETILAELPKGTKLRRAGSEEEGGLPPFEEEIEPAGAVQASGAGPIEIVLAIALPDGRIVAEGGGELRVIGGDARWAALGINGWTGAVTARPGASAGDGDTDRGTQDLPPEDPAEAT